MDFGKENWCRGRMEAHEGVAKHFLHSHKGWQLAFEEKEGPASQAGRVNVKDASSCTGRVKPHVHTALVFAICTGCTCESVFGQNIISFVFYFLMDL